MTETIKISYRDLIKACQYYAQNERRDYVYPNALKKIQSNFGDSKLMADGIADLLDVWHLNFYRFGGFSQDLIEQYINTKLTLMQKYNTVNIRHLTFSDLEIAEVKELFSAFLDATAGVNAKFTRKSPTAVSKTLNLLAPRCFPLWDEAISQAYDCWWVYSDFGVNKYIKFMELSKSQCLSIVNEYSIDYKINDPDLAETKLIQDCNSINQRNYDRSLLKILDEYNYAKYTKNWL